MRYVESINKTESYFYRTLANELYQYYEQYKDNEDNNKRLIMFMKRDSTSIHAWIYRLMRGIKNKAWKNPNELSHSIASASEYFPRDDAMYHTMRKYLDRKLNK